VLAALALVLIVLSDRPQSERACIGLDVVDLLL
jgi:hypothetical protein